MTNEQLLKQAEESFHAAANSSSFDAVNSFMLSSIASSLLVIARNLDKPES